MAERLGVVSGHGPAAPPTVPVVFDGGPADRCYTYLSGQEPAQSEHSGSAGHGEPTGQGPSENAEPARDVVLVAMLSGHAIAYDPPQTAPGLLDEVRAAGGTWTRYVRVSQEPLGGAYRYVVDPMDGGEGKTDDPAGTVGPS